MTLDIAVVGAGLAGAATAWAAARRGLSVRVFEQYAPANPRGSSHGSARIFRRAYADELYVRMTGQARELWQELETASGRTVLDVTGGLDAGSGRDLSTIAGLLADAEVEFELLSAAETSERWPGVAFGGPALFHPQAGVIDAEGAVSAFLEGADLRTGEAVTGLAVSGDGAVVRTAQGETAARRVVVAAGAWVGSLLGDRVTGYRVPLPRITVTQQQAFHFPVLDADLAWPTFVAKDELSTYGLPSGRDLPSAYKIGEHDRGTVTTADGRDGLVDPGARERICGWVARHLPGLDPRPAAETSCLYTRTDDEDFVLDRSGPFVVLSPCSGHGAKFAPLIGEIATDLALDKPAPSERFALPA